MTSVLRDIRVLDLGAVIAGPFTGKLLADLGADVIKIEKPDSGDQFRSYQAGFDAINFGKRSICLDLQSPGGRDALLRLVDDADVLLENFRPGVMERLGLGDDVLRARNPGLVHCAISGFGAKGPYSDRPAFDNAVTALSGFLSLLVDEDHPFVPGPPIADGITALYACYGILGALYERTHTGAGRRIDVNMVESLVGFAHQPFGHLFRTGEVQGPTTRAKSAQAYVARCSDGRLVGLHLSSPDKFWQGLIAALERPDLGTNPNYADYSSRVENYDELNNELAKEFAKLSRADWCNRLEQHEVPHAPVHRIDEAVAEPQFAALGTFGAVRSPEGAELKFVRRPVTIDGERDVATRMPPLLGEHTREVLFECGLSEEQIPLARGRSGKAASHESSDAGVIVRTSSDPPLNQHESGD